MAEENTEKNPKRKGWKIGLIVGVCLLVAIGGIGAATAPSWAKNADSTSNSAGKDAQAGGKSTPTPTKEALPLNFAATPADGATNVNPASEPILKVDGGKITSVTVTNRADGSALPGTISPDGSSWTTDKPLAFNATYDFKYTAQDSTNKDVHKSSSFSTVPSTNEANAAVYPANGAQVGVGQPIQITFSEPVADHAAMEKAITVSTTANQPGGFHWYSDTMVRYRPQGFWAANSTISINAKLLGMDFGGGQIGDANMTSSFKVGDKKLIEADGVTHTAQVFINDQLVRVMPTTLGDTRFPSASGYQVMMDKQKRAKFVASTIGLKPGDPADYGQVWVNNAIRLTNSGQFMHEATPEGMAVLGVANESHGCIGLSSDNSEWVFDNFETGDLVHVTNSGNTVAPPTDGFGDWNIPWEQWAN